MVWSKKPELCLGKLYGSEMDPEGLEVRWSIFSFIVAVTLEEKGKPIGSKQLVMLMVLRDFISLGKGPVQNENVRPLVQKQLLIFRGQKGIKPNVASFQIQVPAHLHGVCARDASLKNMNE